MRHTHPSTFFTDESGETAIEYGLIASLIVIVLLAGLGLFSSAMDGMYSSLATQVGTAMPG